MTTPIQPGSVVVGVDGSAHSDAAVLWAIAFAALRSRPLVLVHALGEISAGERLAGTEQSRQLRRATARRGTERALAVVRRVAPGLDVHELHPSGDPRNALLTLASQASLMVVGSRGHGPVSTLLLGSVSVAVATHAPCAVAVVRPREEAEEEAEGVVVGVAGDGSDRAAVELAAELASAEDGVLQAVHAWSAGDPLVDKASHEQHVESRDRHERALAESLAGLADKFPDLEITQRLCEDGPVHALVERSRTADCVVVGSRGRTGTAAMLGSVSRSLLERAHGTVVVVRP